MNNLLRSAQHENVMAEIEDEIMYSVYYHCLNCYFDCTVVYKKGVMAESSLDCPCCGTGWLKKTKDGGISNPQYKYEKNKLELMK